MKVSQSLHPSVFISSTFVDFMDERKAIADVLKSKAINVNALDIQPASNSSSKYQIERGIAEADFVLLLVGNRYGSIIPQMTGGEVSITHWEYLLATQKYNKNVLVFYRNYNESETISSHYDDDDNYYNEKQYKLRAFKSSLSSKHNPTFFSSISDLASQVKSSIIPAYREIIRELVLKYENEQTDTELGERMVSEAMASISKEWSKSNPNVSEAAFGNAMAEAFKAAKGE
ncbi:TPA: DUF4062 domain-containing protein [Vibrio harveyi]|nr:DUF4062 domain-containing protein [Vibrio harveyi]